MFSHVKSRFRSTSPRVRPRVRLCWSGFVGVFYFDWRCVYTPCVVVRVCLCFCVAILILLGSTIWGQYTNRSSVKLIISYDA